jgi:hypothetical protein
MVPDQDPRDEDRLGEEQKDFSNQPGWKSFHRFITETTFGRWCSDHWHWKRIFDDHLLMALQATTKQEWERILRRLKVQLSKSFTNAFAFGLAVEKSAVYAVTLAPEAGLLALLSMLVFWLTLRK